MKCILPLLAVCLLSLTATASIVGNPMMIQFRLVMDGPATNYSQLMLMPAGPGSSPREMLNVQNDVLLDSSDMKNVTAGVDDRGQPMIDVEFTDAGAKRFAQVTHENVGKRLAIIVGGKLYSAPRINDPVSNGRAIITGNFTPQEAQDLAAKIAGRPAVVLLSKPETVMPYFYWPCLIIIGVFAWLLIRSKKAPPSA